ncbi:sigma factor-like helix-turn-helix DNA-binding protein [Halapricum hydrolyticum]|uniref:Sigma-70 region 4 domain-containing protein n=1 Tax=Halapricum hydrolyticum TaxID=2979991 RepID=A0AAE3LHS3_9EURY|nr:sigma-70 region 4 domain-containing protein [Halapricum hydrolyticum]MCU4716887.1 sigma-70 region 4 domain-containing protein [Halapricum hydrolyticum]MCU4725508.1 sigma-70 region 4 domain-containing protein [Halapricum hydrolyticum]
MSAAKQTTLADHEPDLSKLSPAERDAYEAVYEQGMSGREYARQTDRSWGTVSNLLMRARSKLDVFQDGGRDG